MTSKAAMELIVIDGGQLAVFSFGRGPPVIVLQGGPGDTHHSMKQMAAPLADMFQCIVFDQRGTGQSRIDDRSPARFRLDRLLDDLTAVQRRFEATSVVGHSWGALYALFACLRRPNQFRKAALLAMGPLDAAMERAASERLLSILSDSERAEWHRLRAERNAARERGDIVCVQAADRALMTLRVNAWVFDPDRRQAFLDDYFKNPPPDRDVHKLILHATEDQFAWADLKSVRAQVWIAAGANDLVPPEQAYRTAEMIPDARVRVFERCGHVPWLEHPTEFYMELAGFLSD